ncbi:MAG: NADPH-dependent oxidoreductase [Bacteroidia bacterium]|nr:MAG: NADPH-dependent oxidoreductase [Bacteroidia bacterium]
MITVISGTNRKNSMTLKVAQYYYKELQKKEVNTHLISLEELPVWHRSEELLKVEQELLIPTEKFLFIMPEYNGSFPGILKLLIDNTDIRQCWWYKKAAMVGVADGRGGNLRGIEHMTNILHYLRMNVLYNKIPLSRINEEIDKDGNLLIPATANAIAHQINEFLKY